MRARRRHPIFVVSATRAVTMLILAGLVAVPIAADDTFRDGCFGDEPGTRLFLGGGGSPALGQQYHLDLEWIPEARVENLFQALVVYAEPDHRPVLAHYVRKPDSHIENLIEELSPEATTLVDYRQHSRILTRLERGLTGAEGFSITGIDDAGAETQLVSHASVPVGAFEIGFRYTPAEPGLDPFGEPYDVCCSCSSGCENCKECDEIPPQPTCTCPGCAVSCTH